MNTYEFEARKAELARNILNSQNPEVIERVQQTYEQAVSHSATPPCRYTLEEVKQRLRDTEADAIAGRGLSEEEVDRLIDAMI